MVKRTRSDSVSSSDSGSDSVYSIEGIDISTALAGKGKAKQEYGDEDDDLRDLLHDSIAKRNIKGGTQVLKNAKGSGKLAKGEVGGGSFQSMGLHPSLLRSLTLQGYRIPTPIQRLSIPALLSSPPRDLVGMARTGSGKTLAYMIPLVQRLGGRHATAFGARALILLPARELALQVLKVGKELARGWHGGAADHAGDAKDSPEDNKKGSSLRWGFVVGGEGLDEQFEMIASNPDVIIATPGRLLHLIVEMNLDLKSVQYVVFDEADRLFEMGFETALNEILGRLPATRQTLLFSATLPKSLVEFAKAGLQEPRLVRLDAETKISTDLKMAFFSTKQTEKDACLLSLLRDVIGVPLGPNAIEAHVTEDEEHRKRKKPRKVPEQHAAPHQTLVFAATKHHVEYLTNLLAAVGYAVSHIYGSLDQGARTYQMDQFRRGITNVLVVTDVAARGIDIPVLEHVVNYDFPQGARIFVHRVGRTARAGRRGWAWSFITHNELPFLLDLQLFLGRPLVSTASNEQAYTETLVLGTFEREKIDEDVEYVRTLDDAHHSLPLLREVMARGHAKYERSKGKASPASYTRAKEMSKSGRKMLAGADGGIHPVLLRGKDIEKEREASRKALLSVVNAFRPNETVLEMGSRGKNGIETAELMKARRTYMAKAQARIGQASTSKLDIEAAEEEPYGAEDVEMADEDDIAAVFQISNKKDGYRDPDFYMSHYQKDAMTEKGYSLTDGASSFAVQAQGATFDLTGDDGVVGRQKRQMTWDKKKKKFVKGDGVGADNVKLVTTENGTRLPATYRSGRFDEWKTKNRISMPKNGETEIAGAQSRRPTGRGGHKFKHNTFPTAKPLDKLTTDYERKSRQFKKKEESAGASAADSVRRAGRSTSRVKTEIKTVDQIRKSRKDLEKRRAKNARPSKKKGRR